MTNQTLTELCIKGNDIGDDGITAIAGSLNNSNIAVLNISGCSINFFGIKSLSSVLLTNQSIQELWLYDNPITVDGAYLIMQSAVNNKFCQFVLINDEYEDDINIKKLKTVLNKRRKQDVRKLYSC